MNIIILIHEIDWFKIMKIMPLLLYAISREKFDVNLYFGSRCDDDTIVEYVNDIGLVPDVFICYVTLNKFREWGVYDGGAYHGSICFDVAVDMDGKCFWLEYNPIEFQDHTLTRFDAIIEGDKYNGNISCPIPRRVIWIAKACIKEFLAFSVGSIL